MLGIDRDGFERTLFLSERRLSGKNDNKTVSARLSELVGCDGDIGGVDAAMKKLEDKRLPADIDYKKILGLRLESAEKLDKNVHSEIIDIIEKL